MIYFTSDPHYGHKKVIEYCNRPFKDLDHMTEMLIQNYNSVVKPEDTCVFMGDVFFMGTIKATEILSRMNGYKVLYKGNHDHKVEKMLKIGFDEVYYDGVIEIAGEKVLLSHYPYRPDFSTMDPRVKDTMTDLLQKQKETGRDSSSEIDDVLDQMNNSGLINKEQHEYLTAIDCRYINRRFEDKGGWLINGHVHEKWAQMDRMINVGVDVRNFTPVSIEEIAEIIKRGPK